MWVTNGFVDRNDFDVRGEFHCHGISQHIEIFKKKHTYGIGSVAALWFMGALWRQAMRKAIRSPQIRK